ncbi:1-phosphofructokinase [Agromyces rhizosphaerae]|uniref:1-phosphofructokinase n=1 Tax=Agromyces rhizosphaerae TaxID=88374 RepID=A0A9W6CWS5_9MICO|nr:1-phosphofructokinase [Agromyces rhizosphaerae]
MRDIAIFAPSPLLTVTVEEDEGTDIHLHAGGQGIWQARMLQELGCSVLVCAVLTGEVGRALGHLLADEGIEVDAVLREGSGAAYVHDRRQGTRTVVAETGGDAIDRHELDELYGRTLTAAIDSRVTLLSGPHGDDVVPDDVYRRLAADVRATGGTVVADLAGGRLDAAIAGGVDVAKVSEQELLRDDRIPGTDRDTIIGAMRDLHAAGAERVIVTCAERAALILRDGVVAEVEVPRMEVVDAAGSGDSFVAATVAALARGEEFDEAVALGAAAGAMNVTRHGLGTADAEAVRAMRARVRIAEVADADPHDVATTPDELAAGVRDGT